MLVALLAFKEGLITLRRIAEAIMLRSKGHVSNLVRWCAKRVEWERDVAAWLNECLDRLRPAAMPAR